MVTNPVTSAGWWRKDSASLAAAESQQLERGRKGRGRTVMQANAT